MSVYGVLGYPLQFSATIQCDITLRQLSVLVYAWRPYVFRELPYFNFNQAINRINAGSNSLGANVYRGQLTRGLVFFGSPPDGAAAVKKTTIA